MAKPGAVSYANMGKGSRQAERTNIGKRESLKGAKGRNPSKKSGRTGRAHQS